ncbi:MAG: ABC transporter permease [Deltaproteobacteria bacterium]|nr:ABC transporter permease [Deltaproteobacteria bacterium]
MTDAAPRYARWKELAEPLRSPAGLTGAVLVAIFLIMAIAGPILAPQNPDKQDLSHALQAPTAAHVLGTDENGCDVLSELLHGARLALFIAGTVVSISLIIGLGLGAVAGYAGGWVDEIIMRIVDLLLAFPGILLNLAVVALVPRPTTGYLIFALCLNGWVGFARMARGQVLAVKSAEFVLAARAAGARPTRILAHHIVPQILPPMVVQASFAFAGVVLTEASLSFLGLGPPHHYSWGALLGQGTSYLWLTQRLAIVAGSAIAVVVLGFNLLGDALQQSHRA